MHAYELCHHEDLTTAAWMKRERNVGCLVVGDPAGVSGGERRVGMLTDRDTVTTVIARNTDLQSLVVAEVMSEPVIVSIRGSIDDAHASHAQPRPIVAMRRFEAANQP